jgi:ATP-dependent Clp protease adaptor protein ClpS
MTNPLLSSDKPSDTPPPPPEKPAAQGPATATKSRPARPPIEFLPMFRVLLHNDDKNAADFVVSSIVELTPLNHDRAVQVMVEAHTTGVGLLLVSHKERAELYQDQFQSKSLTVTIEPVE